MGALRTIFGVAIIAISCWLAFFGRQWDTQAMSSGLGRAFPDPWPIVSGEPVDPPAETQTTLSPIVPEAGSAAVADISVEQAMTQREVLLTISAEALNLRDSPSMAGAVIASFPRGSTVAELRREGPWVEVRIDEHTGWMSSRYLEAP